MGKKIRIKEIAKRAGCSPATVSQVFNNPKLVNRQTRVNILELCQQLGYVRKKFKQKRQGVIGVTGISNELMLGEYYNKVVASILSAAKRQGINLIIESFADDEESLPDMLSRKLLDGVIVLGKLSQEHVLMIKQTSIPLVLCGHPVSGIELPTVLSDGRAGSYAITKHLIQLGHKKIAHLTGGPIYDPVCSDRLDGFRFALSEAGLKPSDDYIMIGDFCDQASAYAAVDKLLGLKNPPTAIVCESDSLAYAAYRRLGEKGVKVPKEISLTGFDRLPFPCFLEEIKPKLTTVDVNLDELGKTAFDALCETIENPSRIACRHTLPVQLVVGETSGKNQ
jgi:DNA-binding LacI/PurR family transcriptional regulator